MLKPLRWALRKAYHLRDLIRRPLGGIVGDVKDLLEEIYANLPEAVNRHQLTSDLAMELLNIGCRDTFGPCAAALVESSIRGILDLREQQINLDKLASHDRWQVWLEKEIAAGGGSIHKWSKVPVEWRPQAVRTSAGKWSGLPSDILEHELLRLNGLWQPAARASRRPLS